MVTIRSDYQIAARGSQLKASNWKDVAELLGIVAIVASLVFVGLQIRQDRAIAEAQVFAEQDAVVIEMANLISANRDLWLRGLRGDELSAAD